MSEAMTVVDAWTRLWAVQDIEGAKALATADCPVHFVHAEADMLFSDFCDNMTDLIKSFPDYTFTWGDIVEKEPGVVHLYDCRSKITHTAAPCSFGGYEPIEAKGTVVEDHIPHIKYHIKDGKVAKMDLHAEGKVVGLPGVYLAIGGMIF